MLSETVIQRRTGNTMSKGKRSKRQTKIDKILHRKQYDRATRTSLKTGGKRRWFKLYSRQFTPRKFHMVVDSDNIHNGT